MTEFVSEVKAIPYNEDRIFNLLSDLSNLEKVRDRIPQDKIQEFEFDKDSCSIAVAPLIVMNELHRTVLGISVNNEVLHVGIVLGGNAVEGALQHAHGVVRNCGYCYFYGLVVHSFPLSSLYRLV